jgi:hypothetical protein
MGAQIKVLDVAQTGGELWAICECRSSPVTGGLIEGAMTAALSR